MKLWRLLGVAGLAGVACRVILARDQRKRAQLAAGGDRERLQARLEEAREEAGDDGDS